MINEIKDCIEIIKVIYQRLNILKHEDDTTMMALIKNICELSNIFRSVGYCIIKCRDVM